MATARGSAVRRSGGAPVSALFLTFALGGVVLVSLLSHAVPLLRYSSSKDTLVEDQLTADQLFLLAKASSDAQEFASRLQQAGFMTTDTSSSSSGGSGDSSGAATGSGDRTEATASVKAKGGGKQKPPKKGKAAAVGKDGKFKVPQLSKALAHEHARDGIIIVTWANFHFFDFVLNWVHHIQVHGITNYLVGAMDVETGQALAARGVNVFAMYDEKAGQEDTGLGKDDFGWGSPTFHKMGRQKVDLARTFTDYGLDLCLCDVDTVWINDPTEYFERFPDADILASSDHLAPTNPKGDDGLEQPDSIHSAMNIGLLFFRHSKNTTHFIDAWQNQLDEDPKAWDQNVFNDVAHQGLMPFQSPPNQPRLVWGADHSLVFGVLPVAQFASGHTFFVQRLFEYQQVKPYVVHTTFQYGGSSGKRHRLREALLWVDPPEYHTEGRFLSVDLTYPATPADYQIHDQLKGERFKTDWNDKEMIDFHLKSMEQQLVQLKTALQLAVALNRTIIMPKLLSWCDRYWGPVELCQVPGAFKTRLPFVAPMDHILEPYHFNDGGKHKPELGPAINFREYSFLMNERTPKSLKDSRVTIKPSASVQKAEERQEEGKKVVLIPQQQSDAQLQQLLAPYKDAQLLHFSSLEGAFGQWQSPQMRDGFQRRITHMMGFFCCKLVKEGEDGAVGYAQYVED